MANTLPTENPKTGGPKWHSGGSNWDDTQSLGINYGNINIVDDYCWTLSEKNSREEVPYIDLVEHAVDESTIKIQLDFYFQGLKNFGEGGMAPYENLFPRKETGNRYRFPYFSDVNFEVNTPVWQSLDQLEEGSKAISSMAGVLGGEKLAGAVAGALQFGGTVAGAGLSLSYPKVGIMDRPRLWQNHEFRSITVKFPLFNTQLSNDWEKNRGLCWTLMNANLFYKRDFITGIPPVYYEVSIPGQHYSYASCVTNLTINNRGNMRRLKTKKGIDAIVPDAYEVNMTLTDMAMPSRNLFIQTLDPPIKVE
jgi:hypothetical protein